jgi:hypothetical protein
MKLLRNKGGGEEIVLVNEEGKKRVRSEARARGRRVRGKVSRNWKGGRWRSYA